MYIDQSPVTRLQLVCCIEYLLGYIDELHRAGQAWATASTWTTHK